jgi:hypothetical protein
MISLIANPLINPFQGHVVCNKLQVSYYWQDVLEAAQPQDPGRRGFESRHVQHLLFARRYQLMS